MEEVRSVVAKRGALDRFGLTLLRSHFVLAPEEVLVETLDLGTRTLTVRPVPASELRSGELVPTSWDLDHGGAEPVCGTYGHRAREFHACGPADSNG